MFVLLAVFFAAGFIFFGVGSGNSGLNNFFSDVFTGGGRGGAQSISKAQKAVDKNPANAKAWRDLATAYTQKNRNGDAISALQRYTQLKPKDPRGLSDLAGLQLSQANDLQTQASVAQYEQQQASAGTQFSAAPSSKIARAIGTDPIQGALSTDVNQRASDLYSRMQAAFTGALTTYQSLAKVLPRDATVQFQLAQAAESANQIPVAVTAYRKFLKLDPENAIAPQVRARVAQLQPPPVKKKPTTGKKSGGKG